MIPKIIDFILSPIPDELNFFERKEVHAMKSTLLSKTLKWEPQAVQVIKEKIAHYKKNWKQEKASNL